MHIFNRRNCSIVLLLALKLGCAGIVQAATPQLAAGDSHSVALTKDGSVLAWGSDAVGALGQGRQLSSTVPVTSSLKGAVQIAARNYTVAARLGDGTWWVWGKSLNNTGGATSTPVPISEADLMTSLDFSFFHTIGLKGDGTVWSWGNNWYGQLGDSSTQARETPVQAAGLSGVTQVVAGDDYSLALKSDGTVWAWGNNQQGQLGDTTTTNRNRPVQVASLANVVSIAAYTRYSVAVKADGTVWAWGARQYADTAITRPTVISGLSNVTRISVGYSYALALTTDGAVWHWGTANSGPVTSDGISYTISGEPTKVDGLTEITSMTFNNGQNLQVLKRDGTVWGVSLASYNLANGVARPVLTARQVASLTNIISLQSGWSFTAALTGEGSILSIGGNEYGQFGDSAIMQFTTPRAIAGLRDITAISAFDGESYAIRQDGSLWWWGRNMQTVPEQVSGITDVKSVAIGYSIIALRRDGSVWQWNQWVATFSGIAKGDDTVVRYSSTPIAVSGLPCVTAVSTGILHAVAVKCDGTVWTWGVNQYGQLGDGTTTHRLTTPVQVLGLNDVISVTAGQNHTVAVKRDGTVWTWGANLRGELGVNIPAGANEYRSSPVQVTGLTGITRVVSAPRSQYTVAFRSDGTIWSWPSDNITAAAGSPTNALLPVSLPSLKGVVDIVAQTNHWLALRGDGTVAGLGNNTMGQLGNGTVATSTIPTTVLDQDATGFLSLTGASGDNSVDPFRILQIVGKTPGNLTSKLTDLRASGFMGEIYFTALLPASSPVVRLMRRGYRDGGAGQITACIGRGGAKQMGATVTCAPFANEAIVAGNHYSIYEKLASDPLANSNAIICMGFALPALSAKGQVLMQPIATGDLVKNAVQCPTVQTEATIGMYVGEIAGPLTARSISAKINPLAEDRGQVRNVYSWAVAPDGTQFMQTGPYAWALMTEPMNPVMNSITVPASGPITVPVLNAFDASSLVGTLVYVGMGTSWEEVRTLNKAGHYYTVQ